MSVVKKSFSAWLDWATKKKKKVQKVVKKLSKSSKIVKKLSNILSNLVKINKKEITVFLKIDMILENWV
jgi:thiamine kinase-like enzyme